MIKDLQNRKNFERIYLGGTGTMYMVHGKGKDYIYKPAESKWGKHPEPFRGIVQECAYEIQNIVDPESAIMCKYFETDDICGSLQEYIVVDEMAPDYFDFQLDGRIAELKSAEIDQFMREFVTDYLLFNFDSHGRNFITDKRGIIRGVDKEQSFRYMNEEEAQKPSLSYSPNTIRYGEEEPIYNNIFRAYRDGLIDIDFAVIDKYMTRVEMISENQYRKIFEPYCLACSSAFGEDSQAKLNRIVARKNNMRENVESFFQQLTEERQHNTSTHK